MNPSTYEARRPVNNNSNRYRNNNNRNELHGHQQPGYPSYKKQPYRQKHSKPSEERHNVNEGKEERVFIEGKITEGRLQEKPKSSDDDSKPEEEDQDHNQTTTAAKMKKDDDFIAIGNKQYLFDPYNSLNCEITQTDVQQILKNYGIETNIHHFVLYKRAFVHKSYTRRPFLVNQQNNVQIAPKPDECFPLYTKSNERLEFLGDGVLECIAKFYLYKRFPKADEGFMTDTKIEIVKNETVGRIAQEMGLQKWLMLSKHTETKNIRSNHKRLGCLFEAFVGALFLDFNRVSIKDEEGWFQNMFMCGPGFQMAQIFVENVFDRHIDWTKVIKSTENFKRPLQELLQSEFKVTTHAMEIEPYSMEHGYHMGVYLVLGQAVHGVRHEETIPYNRFTAFGDIHRYMALNHKIFVYLGDGMNKIKQNAEQMACKNAIEQLKGYRDFMDVVEKIQQKHNVYNMGC
jgi:dsRNA-specific ribonuclease